MSMEDIHEDTFDSGEPRPWKFTIWHSIGLMVLLGITQAWVYLGLSKASGVEIQDMSWMHIALINGTAGVVTAWVGSILTGYSLLGALSAGSIDLTEALSAVITVLGVVVLSSELNNVLQWIVPIPDAVDMPDKFMQENLGGVLLTVGLIAPVTEELIFRGVILDNLRSSYRLQTAIFVSALLFALVHVHPYMMVNAFLLGLLFAVIRLRTGSLLLCVIAHGVYNSLPFVLTRVFSVDIPGFTSVASGQVQFQPLWLDILGLGLTAGGLVGLRLSRNPE